MVHTIQWRVGSDAALDFWEQPARDARRNGRARRRRPRLRGSGGPPAPARRVDGRGRAARRGASGDPRRARAPGLRRRSRVRGGAEASRQLLEETLGFLPPATDAWEARGPTRGGALRLRRAAAERGVGGAGTVHHVAWASRWTSRRPWRERVAAAGCIPRRSSTASGSARSTSASRAASSSRSRRSALASRSTRIPTHLGESLVLPPAFEHLRDQVEPVLTPIRTRGPWAKIG